MAETVTVKTIEWHTYNGHTYNVGDTYEIAEELVDSIVAQRKAVVVDRTKPAASTTRATGVKEG